MRRLLWLLATLSLTAFGADAPRNGILVDLSADASQSAPNDQGLATAFAEADAPSSADAARKVNTAIAQAFGLCKRSPSVQCRSGRTWTSPVYGKNDRRIEGWHVRSEVLLESRDLPALAGLLSSLQSLMGVGELTLQPAADTRLKAEEAATNDALDAFRTRAKLIAARLGKDYRIVQIQVGSNRGPVYPMKATALRSEAVPMPLEAGESQVTVNVSGQIEVLP